MLKIKMMDMFTIITVLWSYNRIWERDVSDSGACGCQSQARVWGGNADWWPLIAFWLNEEALRTCYSSAIWRRGREAGNTTDRRRQWCPLHLHTRRSCPRTAAQYITGNVKISAVINVGDWYVRFRAVIINGWFWCRKVRGVVVFVMRSYLLIYGR